MKNSHTFCQHRQRGAVLVVSLIMLAVMTMFVISMLKTAVIELKIGGSSQVATQNLANADIAIENFMALNSGRFVPKFITEGKVAPGSDSFTGYAGTVTLVPVQLNCGPLVGTTVGTNQYGPQSLQAVQFDLAATAIGTTGYSGATVVHQGLLAMVGAGACS